jgi:3-dehydroquinate dehydratase type I
MRQSRRSDQRGKICVPIVEATVGRALGAMKEANALGDLVELRMDYLKRPELEPLIDNREKPIIVVARRKDEGGKYPMAERMRLGLLKKAVDLDADYIDVEMRNKRSFVQALMAHRAANNKRTRIILSFHDFQRTPSPKDLQKICDRMIHAGADVVKIAAYAQSWEDNLHLLSLIPYAKKRNQRIIAICMGEHGKMSRVFAPFMGIDWTYASLGDGRASAPGQLTVQEMKELWRRLR